MKPTIYHQRPASTAFTPLCGADAPPERSVNNHRTEIPEGGRLCLRCNRKLLGLRITTRVPR